MPAPRLIKSHAALRGIAALMVVAYHLQFGANLLPIERATSFFRHSYLFVDLFFVMSGFIISYVNDAARMHRLTKAEAKRFFYARFARLYPLHLFCLSYLVIGLAAVTLARVASGGTASFYPFYWEPRSLLALLAQLLLINAWLPSMGGWNIPTWSISAEVVAYALFPLIVTLHVRWRRSSELCLLITACAFYLGVATSGGSLDLTLGLGPLRCLAGFFLGMLVYFRRDAVTTLSDPVLSLLQILAVTVTIFVLAVPFADPLAIVPFVTLVATTWTDRGLLARALGTKVPQWLGDISYSIYLNHVCLNLLLANVWAQTVDHWLRDPAADRIAWIFTYVSLVLAWSTFTYRYVERPARQWLASRLIGHRAPPIAMAPAAP